MRNPLSGVTAAVAAAALAWAPPVAAQGALTYSDLVRRLIELESLAVAPQEGETCAQWSSWDRASRYDPESKKYVRWDANGDGAHFIRREGDRGVMAEMEGPGCLWRVWSALPQTGHVKIYLDGSADPVVDLPFADYFNGRTAPFNYPMLSYRLEDLGSRGQNLYFPIPYRKSCKIVAEKGWGRYYHFTYSTFPKGTRIPTFSPDLIAENSQALRGVNDYLAERLGTDPAGPRDNETTGVSIVRAGPGETASIAELSGPRAITLLRVKASIKDRPDAMAALRRMVLAITWDEQPQPAVWCPLGDFFGTAPGENHYRSIATGMTAEGYYSLWYMPFARKAELQLINEDEVAREVPFEIVHAPLSRPFRELSYFHCKWHRNVFPLPQDRFPDWVMLRTRGRGRFCGVMLHVWNPRGGWWGEGDEKFFVDGETYPSTFGTGSEDYFGYAWGHPGLFQRPYHCQTMTQNNQGHQSLLRWHIADNVPFQKSFEGCIEKYFGDDRGTLFACVACWYLSPGGVDPFRPVSVKERHSYYRDPGVRAGGFKVLEKTAGNVETQRLAPVGGRSWKNGDHLWWTGAKPGDKLAVAVPVKAAAGYRVSVALTKARDYGIVQLYLDGEKLGTPIDLYDPDVVPTGPMELGMRKLGAGESKLSVEIVGANEKAIKAYMFGLDSVILERMCPKTLPR